MSNQKKTSERPDPPEGSCHFFVERKRRYCRFKPSKNASYCAEHATVHGVDLGRKRVNCPYDSKHTCYADKLNHHMKKCPSRPREMPPYYSAGINSGDNAGETVPDPKETVLTIPLEELQALIDKVNTLYDEHIGEIEKEVLSHPCLKDELENPTYGTAAIRHRKQQASIIGQMERLGLLTDGKCYLEMGAGKGQLSHWLHGAVEKCKDIGFVLIDRSHVRNKMDNLHKEEMIMERIRIDIENLRLDHVPSIEKHDRDIVAFGKHLCGPATDLALRCATETLSLESTTLSGENTPERKRLKSDHRKLAGGVIALCCHHRCNWTPYVGKSFFKSCGLTARDFQVISSMTSWATCAWKGWSYLRKVEGQRLQSMDTENNKTTTDNISNRNTKEFDHNNSKVEGHQLNNEMNEKGEPGQMTVNEKLDSSTDTKSYSQSQTVSDIPTSQKNTSKVKGESSKGQGDSTEGQGHSTVGQVDTNKGQGDGERVEDDEEDHCQEEETTTAGISSKLSQEAREIIGRKCKRLIDHGRVQYLQEHGLKSCLKIYVDEFYTPENVALVAWS